MKVNIKTGGFKFLFERLGRKRKAHRAFGENRFKFLFERLGRWRRPALKGGEEVQIPL